MTTRTITAETARRLAIQRQHLAQPRPAATPESMLQVIRDLGCLQLDPISAVARSHTLVLFSRVGAYDLKHLDQLMWEDRALFEYWAHVASIVLTEDFPIYAQRMRDYAQGDDPWSGRVREWVAANTPLRDFILQDIREKGARLSRELEQEGLHPEGWVSSGWTSGRNVSRMLDHLWSTGEIMVSGRKGGQKVWDLTERFLPASAPRDEWNPRRVTYMAAQRAIRALGVATANQIKIHFIRYRYVDLPAVLEELEREGLILRVKVEKDRREWYIHADDIDLLDSIERGEFSGRTTLLSPFDNLICDRKRTKQLWDFDFTVEIYVPAAKRKFGYYVLPILHGDRLIGRVDPTFEKKTKTLRINAVFAEENAPLNEQTALAIKGAIDELGTFLGAKEIAYTDRVPGAWRAITR